MKKRRAGRGHGKKMRRMNAEKREEIKVEKEGRKVAGMCETGSHPVGHSTIEGLDNDTAAVHKYM